MYADCPSCRRQFIVRAQHLAAAAGEVRCGFCGHQFNALQRLRDAPLPDLSPLPRDEAGDEPQFDVPADASGAPPSRAAAAPRATAVLPPAWTPELVEDEAAPGGPLWTVAALLLLAAAALQVVWFHRDPVLLRLPQLMPLAARLCESVQCSVIRHRDLAAIRLLNRDVRLHPRYENFLLVNATMANESGELQPFPRVQLAVYDTKGNALAYNAFEPNEYLDKSIDVQQGMTPGTPVHFVLEVTGPTEGAVSFEFGFL